MFNTAHPRRGGVLGVGLAPGAAGFLVLDVDDDSNVAAFRDRELPATYTVTTASRSAHYWFRKPEACRVGTRCDWDEVDVVRADDGFVVAPGVTTPWGSWVSHEEFPGDVAVAPAALWLAIEHGNGDGASGSSAVDFRGLAAVVKKLREADRGQDADALTVLVKKYNAHHPFMKGDEVFVTRPGKAAGTSASVGYSAPGVVKMFSKKWSPFEEGGRYVVSGDDLVDADELLGVNSPPQGEPATNYERHVRLMPASSIKVRRVNWLWEQRIALGTLALLAGPEGLGKSTVAYWLAARITRGELPGEYDGQPLAVLVCATEDSWEHTIVPRLMAHGADLDRVYRIEVEIAPGIGVGLSLPRDLDETERLARRVGARLLVLDPLMSRLHESLDTHRDGDVRRALEPLASMCNTAAMSSVGLIHHNKSGSTNPLRWWSLWSVVMMLDGDGSCRGFRRVCGRACSRCGCGGGGGSGPARRRLRLVAGGCWRSGGGGTRAASTPGGRCLGSVRPRRCGSVSVAGSARG